MTPHVALTKSRFMAGWQCHRHLWWLAHDPDADELKPDTATRDLFDQARQVEKEAQSRFPGGVVIGAHFDTTGARLAATKDAIARGEQLLFEASFEADGVQVRADILQRSGDTWTLVEVKSTSEVKDEHIPDAAVQLHVLRRSGLSVARVEIMHLNRDFRHPDDGELLARTDVTTRVVALSPAVPDLVAEQLVALGGALPAVGIGAHCSKPRDCPFWDRCWPQDRFHVTKLYRGRPKGLTLMESGIELMQQIPSGQKLTDTQQRQKRSADTGALVVEPGLKQALEIFKGRIGYLDFETIGRAVPVWAGTKPWQQTVVQFSYHEDRDGAEPAHVGWLAEGPGDPRAELVDRMLDATKDADSIVMYSSFERSRIRDLQDAVPLRRTELKALEEKLVDLLPVMQDYVYHPDFNGSFSLKYALSPLVPDIDYKDLIIHEGRTASVEIWRLLFVGHLIPREQRDALRAALLEYCKTDTLATVRLLAKLRELAG